MAESIVSQSSPAASKRPDPGATVEVTATTEPFQCAYILRAVDEKGMDLDNASFCGLNPFFGFRLPPQSLQIQRSLRAEVMRDIGRGYSVVAGGEGIGRIQISGTHGVGPVRDENKASDGLNFRNSLTAFFDAFVIANDSRGRIGKPLLQMVFEMTGGKWSNPTLESYYVWPESFPSDSRTAGRPHAWDWSLSLNMLSALKAPPALDESALLDPAAAVQKLTGLLGLLEKMVNFYKSVKALVQKIRNVINLVKSIVHAVQRFVQGAKDLIYSVTDLVRSLAQNVDLLLKAINPKDFMDDATLAYRAMLYDVRKTAGQLKITAAQFTRSGNINASLTPVQTASPMRPVSVPVAPKDTLAGLAARLLGDSSSWPDLVSINKLDFPFLDFSGTNGAADPAYAAAGLRVLGAGANLKVPLPATPGVVGIAMDPFGTDLRDSSPNGSPSILIGGMDNLAAALQRRFRTLRGRIPWHPTYGSLLPRMIGTPQALNYVETILAEVTRCLEADTRVLSIEDVSAEVDGPSVVVTSSVNTPLGPLRFSAALS